MVDIVLVSVSVALLASAVWWLVGVLAKTPDKAPPLELVRCEGRNHLDRVITVKRGTGQPFVVRGGTAVFHFYPSGERCSVDLNTELATLVRRYEWAEEMGGQNG